MKLREQAQFRPKQDLKPPPSEKGFALTLLVLVLAVYWVLIPIWPVLGTEILGDVDTDAIRGMWGFDHIRRSMIPPNTIPKMVGTIGRFNRFEINPNTSKSAAMAQSAIEFRREYTPTKLNRNIAPTA